MFCLRFEPLFHVFCIGFSFGKLSYGEREGGPQPTCKSSMLFFFRIKLSFIPTVCQNNRCLYLSHRHTTLTHDTKSTHHSFTCIKTQGFVDTHLRKIVGSSNKSYVPKPNSICFSHIQMRINAKARLAFLDTVTEHRRTGWPASFGPSASSRIRNGLPFGTPLFGRNGALLAGFGDPIF